MQHCTSDKWMNSLMCITTWQALSQRSLINSSQQLVSSNLRVGLVQQSITKTGTSRCMITLSNSVFLVLVCVSVMYENNLQKKFPNKKEEGGMTSLTHYRDSISLQTASPLRRLNDSQRCFMMSRKLIRQLYDSKTFKASPLCTIRNTHRLKNKYSV